MPRRAPAPRLRQAEPVATISSPFNARRTTIPADRCELPGAPRRSCARSPAAASTRGRAQLCRDLGRFAFEQPGQLLGNRIRIGALCREDVSSHTITARQRQQQVLVVCTALRAEPLRLLDGVLEDALGPGCDPERAPLPRVAAADDAFDRVAHDTLVHAELCECGAREA